MAQRIIRRSLTPEETEEVRAIIAKVQWTPTSSKQYEKCPHCYVIRFRPAGITIDEWDRFAYFIKHCSVPRIWHDPGGNPHKYWYLILDGKLYWVDWPALNCAEVSSISPPESTASEATPAKTSTCSDPTT